MSQFVMVVDDSMTVRKILEVCLHRAGYEVKCFPDGVEAIRWLMAPQARIPDLVCVDLGLPKIDGYELIRQLKTDPVFVRTAFVIVSRRDSVIDKLKGRRAFANAYLTKPFKVGEIIAVVQAHLGALAQAGHQGSGRGDKA
jgi:twitching motility two-component system response regulator PilG